VGKFSARSAGFSMCFAILPNRAKLDPMKANKEKFDALLGKLLKAKPEPRKKIKTQGKRGPKTPILSR
jgi:hypothetical protein